MFLFLLPSACLADADFELDLERSLTVQCTYADEKTYPHEHVTVKGTTVDEPDADGVTTFQKGEKWRTVTHVVSTGQVSECVFPSGNRIRVKVGSGIATAFGACGSDPAVFTSIWVNERKVVSRLQFEGRCWDSQNHPAVTFDFSGGPSASFRRCHIAPLPESDSDSSIAKPAGAKPLPVCINYPDLKRYPIDLIEYPRPGQKTKSVGDFEVLSNTGPVCDAMLDKLKEDAHQQVDPSASQPASTLTYPDWRDPTVKLPKELEEGSEGIFDVDNDGNLDRVILKSRSDHYTNGSTLLVMPGRSKTELKVPRAPLGPKSWFLPCQMDPVRHSIQDCPTFSQNADEAGFSISSGGKDPVLFRARYTSLTPFFFQGQTHLEVNGTSEDTQEYFAVLKPLPHKRFQKMCLFRQVPENF
ncbi:hypothetical protein ACWA7J_17780 [Leptothrix sp. BB-4]